ncbi:MAG: protease complex subunit PrcB family protein [Stenotrophobium sp.]
MAWIKRGVGLLCIVLLPGCAAMTQVVQFFSGAQPAYVQEAGRAEDCGVQRPETTVLVLASADEVRKWQVSRGIALADDDALKPGPYALVELGSRPSGGYGLVISRDADVRKEVLVLKGTFFAPDAGQPAAQGASSPCVLVSLPSQPPYRGVSVVDQLGHLRATTLTGG